MKELAAATGESGSVLVKVAVQERLDRVTNKKGREMVKRRRGIQERVRAMPELDARSADEVIGYFS